VGVEIELKFLLREGDPEKIGALAPVRRRARGAPQVERLVSTYFDTPERTLWHLRLAFRIRRTGGAWIQTVKTKGVEERGILTRQEVEHAVVRNHPDFERLTGSPFAEIFADEALRRDLRPLFTTDFERHAWMLHGEQGVIELALDRGVIRAGEREVPILELELELKAGQPAEIHVLAAELAALLDMEKSTVSKAERGYNLLAPRRP